MSSSHRAKPTAACFRRRRRLCTGLLVLSSLISSCAAEPEPEPPSASASFFGDVTGEVGVDFVHLTGAEGQLYFPEIMGAGVALLDIEGDGDLDLYFVQGGVVPIEGTATTSTATNRLYRNDLDPTAPGKRPLSFTDVTESSGTGDPGYGMGVAVGDYDGDGDPDIYVTNYGPNALLRNEGDGTFVDVTATAGVADDRWSVSAAFLDYDLDGDLDLFSVNYVWFSDDVLRQCRTTSGDLEYCTPAAFRTQADILYRNDGDGSFTDVTVSAGIDGEPSAGLGVISSDFDDDGRPDLYVANDAMPNQLWINRGDRFEETGLPAGAALNDQGATEAGMGVAAADIDDDGDQDLFVTHLFGETNTLYVNLGEGVFIDRTSKAGLGGPSRSRTGFGNRFFDYDNDGTLDLMVVNGAVAKIDTQLEDPWPYKMQNQLFHGLSEGRFEDVSALAGPGFSHLRSSRGAAIGDLDLDGGLDIVINNNNDHAQVLLNRAAGGTHWIRVDPAPRIGTPEGTLVSLRSDGATTASRTWHTAGSYASASDGAAAFGLGSDAAPVDVLVHWPNGERELFTGLEIDREVTLSQGSGSQGSGSQRSGVEP